MNMLERIGILSVIVVLISLLLLWKISFSLKKIETAVTNPVYVTPGVKLAGARAPHGGGIGADDIVEVSLYSASWCGYCKIFEPTWEKVKLHLSGNNRIRFRKIDCSDSSHMKAIKDEAVFTDGSSLDGFPTITLRTAYRNGTYSPQEKFGSATDRAELVGDKIKQYLRDGRC